MEYAQRGRTQAHETSARRSVAQDQTPSRVARIPGERLGDRLSSSKMTMKVTRRAWARLLGGAALAELATACVSTTGQSPGSHQLGPATPSPDRNGSPGLTLTLANSELAVGPNRFAMAMIEDGRPVANATVKYEFFQIDGQAATKRSDADSRFVSLEGSGKGLYVARVAFD